MARKPSRGLAAVVMAAGKGKRLKSRLPKVLHPVCGRPTLWHVLRAVTAVRPERVILVVAHESDQVHEAVRAWGLELPVRFVDQGDPLGTGHAVMVAESAVGRIEDVLVVSADEPLVTGEQLRDLVAIHRRNKASATVQTTLAPGVRGLGHVVRDGDAFEKIAEAPRATEHAAAIPEVATGMYVFRRDDLFKALPLLSRDNRQHEYYLVDALGILREKGERIVVQQVDNGGSVGTNSRAELAAAAAVMRRRVNEELMDRGVTLVDPDRTYVDASVTVGPDTVIHPLTFLEGDTTIGRDCVIGPSTRIVDSTIGDAVEIQFSVVRESTIGSRVTVGPYAHLRPGTEMGEGAKAGTFVEIKKSTVGRGSKVPHLAYVGDAEIGKDANIGAGTITCNYDGFEKHRTVIGDGAFIGSDTMLVAPVKIGKEAVTGAGSAITKDVPPGALAIERSEQKIVEGYAKRRRKRARDKRTKGH
ncbi:MAG TPA: bifunctional UDP-N-acetylglucosamine diphosphorylase/glucosamine-1-phosphate N-acetyltransferase GlmU [Actinomycetota bacterium]|nr:bifunctional UDP-N-acetylglucosamine diphosphorylase/glucosamine-1-phosphate N-acetyltransferase GlmU [Actinomycetota bacterium]